MSEVTATQCACGDPQCGKRRQGLNIFASEEDAIEYRIIRTRVSCASQAMQVQAIPTGVTAQDVQMFVTAAIESKADSLVMESLWWRSSIQKYALNVAALGDVYFDVDTKEFFINKE